MALPSPAEQSGYRIHRWGGEPVWERFPVAPPGRFEALVQVEACGVGLTVLNSIRGDLVDDGTQLPRVPGHELVGRIVAVGPGVDAERIGRRVAAYFYLSCGECPECVAGEDNRCRRVAGFVGITTDGGYAPYATLPDRSLIEMPEGLDALAATVVPDAVATPVHICRSRARVGPEDRVAVIGAGGGVGIHLLQVARIYGARVAGLDVTPEKIEAIEAQGAIAVRSDDFAALEADIFPDGPPTVVVDFLGSAASLDWGTRAIDRGGRIVLLTTFPDTTGVLDPQHLVVTESTILGSRYASRAEVRIAAALVAGGRVTPVISKVTGPEGVLGIHEQLRHGSLIGRGAIVWS